MSQGKSQSQERLEKLHKKVRELGQVVMLGPLASSFPEHLAHFPVIGVDGGAGVTAIERYDFTIGDGDSLTKKIVLDQAFSVDKAHSDLALALQILPLGPWHLHLWGFAGGRLDHQMMNLGELANWLRLSKGKLELMISSEERLHGFDCGKHQVAIEGLFSLFSPYISTFEISGACRYSLPATEIKPFSSQLLSNVGHGNICIDSSEPFFCYQGRP